MAKRNDDFQTLQTAGGLLPADQLMRIAAGDADGIAPGDYDLPPGEKINEAISQSWSRLCKHWEDFRQSIASLPEDQPGTDVTNQKWLLPVFRELGYGKLTTTKAPEIDGKTYAISRFHGPLPIHLVGCNIQLDKRTPGVKGAATGTPHGLVQEFLNRSEDFLWAFVSNGLRLRILRDNVALSRQAYVEFDLEAMFEGEVYSDFAMLWMLCHVTRTEGDRPEQCRLEKWSSSAREHGTRVLADLRNGVEKAIEALGRGFVSHSANDHLRKKLRDGQLDKQALYHQVLRMVYRLLFLFVAEDRDLLHPPGSTEQARDTFDQYYSTRRLRDLAEQIKGSRHGDLWHTLSLTFAAVSGQAATEPIRTHLGLPALGSLLWDLSKTPDVVGPGPGVDEPVHLANDDLLDAIRHLAFVEQNRTLRRVDYRNLGTEELGSVYESLLELQPDINIEARHFELRTVTGSERKTTGSYYTPDSLVQCLLDSALEPVIEDRLKSAETVEDKQQALLDLTVCDPACGSGHFLIGAAHRITRHLARLRAIAAGEAESTPDVYQHALRDVIAHCVYGVDINPMAVELCKVSLWLETIDPGRPLAFLDHHIQCGNSLLGTTPALLKKGIPDEAFKAIEGDDKEVCKQLKKENKSERQGQRRLWGAMPSIHLGNMAQTLANIDAEDDSTPEAIAQKEKHYQEFVSSSGYENARFLADAWCAAFVWPKTDPSDPAITTEAIRRIEDNPHEYPEGSPIREGVHKLAKQYQFFHWHLVFPDVFRVPAEDETPGNEHTGWSGGFDCVLGNPPWETMSPDAKEFFAAYDPQVRFLKKKEQKELIDRILTDEKVASQWRSYRRDLFAAVHFMKSSGRYALFAPGNLGKGDFDLYRMFVETALRTTADGGFAAQIVKSGIYNGANAQAIRKELFEHWDLRLVLGFINTGERWFPGVHPETRFALYVANSNATTSAIATSFMIDGPDVLPGAVTQPVRIPLKYVYSQSPASLAIPETTSQIDIDVSTKMTEIWPPFSEERTGEPYRHYQREIDMGNDRDVFGDYVNGLPLYEGRMIGHYDYRAKAYRSGRGRAAVWDVLSFGSPEKQIVPQWRVPQDCIPTKLGDRTEHYRLVWCDVATPTSPRSLTAALVPPGVICGDTAPTIRFQVGCEWAYMLWLGAANSLCLDYLVRKKIALHIKYTHMDSLPFPRSGREMASTRRICDLAIRLTCTGPEMTGYWNAMAQDGWCVTVPEDSIPPCFCDEPLRAKAKAAIDALVARDLYDLRRNEFEFIIDSFKALRRQEERACGEFLTKRLVLAAYDDIEAAIGELISQPVPQEVLDKGHPPKEDNN